MSEVPERDDSVIHWRLDQMSKQLEDVTVAMKEVAKSLTALVRLEENHKMTAERLTSGSARMEKIEERLAEIEKAMPGLKELRRWVIGGVLAGLGMMGTAVGKLVLLDPADPPAIQAKEPKK